MRLLLFINQKKDSRNTPCIQHKDLSRNAPKTTKAGAMALLPLYQQAHLSTRNCYGIS
jgi:hypothetical protein